MPRLQVIRGTHFRRERGRIVEYRRGDQFQGTANEAKHMKDKLREIGPAQVRTVDPDPDLSTDTGGAGTKKVSKKKATKKKTSKKKAAKKASKKTAKKKAGKPVVQTDDSTDDDELTVPQLKKMAEDLDIEIPSDLEDEAAIREYIDEAIASM